MKRTLILLTALCFFAVTFAACRRAEKHGSEEHSSERQAAPSPQGRRLLARGRSPRENADRCRHGDVEREANRRQDSRHMQNCRRPRNTQWMGKWYLRDTFSAFP